VELSQQLDQWQLDMQSLIDEQLKNKMNSQEKEEQMRRNSNESSNQTLTTKLAANLSPSNLKKSRFLNLWRHKS